MHPTAQGFVFDFTSEALLKRRKQVVSRVKRGILKKLAKKPKYFQYMTITLLILGFGVSPVFFLIQGTPLYAEYSATIDLLYALYH